MLHRRVVTVLIFAIAALAGIGPGHASEQWLADHRAWQKARLDRLVAPDGWLTLVGLHWLPSEPQGLSLGSGEDSDIQLSAGPSQLAVIGLDDGAIRVQRLYQQPDNLEASINDFVWSGDDALQSRLQFGPWSVELIERDGRFGLRERHAEARTRTEFAGLESYPADRQWRLPARFVAHEPQRTLRMSTVAGVDDLMRNPGVLEFEIHDQPFRLEALQFEGSDQLFIVFADRSSGFTTYGGGRFVYTELPDLQGEVLLDFNRAYNPPCVFTDYSTCPLPPPGNRLDIEVTAGERLPPDQL